MTTPAEARTALAAAVTTAGVQCLAYPPDNPAPPAAFVDSVAVDFTIDSGFIGGSFCAPGAGTASVVVLAQRHDRQGSIAYLEGLIAPILDELQALRGLQLVSATSGSIPVGGQDLPAVVITVRFPV